MKNKTRAIFIADDTVLTTLANRTNGKFFTGNIENISEVYFLISSEF